MYNFNYEAREVISKAGKEGEVQYGAQKLMVDAVAYLNFPREADKKLDKEKTHPLIKILRADVPIKDAELKDWTEEAVVGALRLAFGQLTWVKAIEDMKTINDKVNEVFKDADGALIKAGFREKGIKLVVAEIKLPKGIEDALPQIDQQRLEAEAAPFEAKQRTIETIGAIVQMMAEAQGVSTKTIQDQINTDPVLQKEFFNQAKYLIAREQAIKGNSFVNIEVQGAEGLERVLLNLLAVWQRMPVGKPEQEPEPKKEEVKADGIEKPLSPRAERIMKRTGEALKKMRKKRRS